MPIIKFHWELTIAYKNPKNIQADEYLFKLFGEPDYIPAFPSNTRRHIWVYSDVKKLNRDYKMLLKKSSFLEDNFNIKIEYLGFRRVTNSEKTQDN